ncbi:MAG: hypothetical protein NUV52_04040 [Candidatus Roizmanbacteria bacterium]|nr:hypothetical protein [Candidatus Roizmanbacteria bacterium]
MRRTLRATYTLSYAAGIGTDGAFAGAFALRLGGAPSYTDTGIGFRCTSDPVAISQSWSSSSGRSATGGNTVTNGSVSEAKLYQTVNVGDAVNYELSAYVYDNTVGNQGGTVTSSIAQLYYNGAVVATTYANAGSGWWRLSASITGAPESREYGVVAKLDKEIITDDFSLTRASVPSPFYDPYITMSNSRFSFRAALSGAHSSGASILTIATAGSADFDEETHNLFPGDILCLTSTALAGCQNQTTYQVNNSVAADTVGITPALAANLLATDQLVASQSGTLTVTFQPQNSVESGGHVLLTVPSSTSLYQDGIPDATGWDSALLPADLLAGTGCSGNACFTSSGFTVSAVSLSNTGSGTHTINITTSSVLDQGTFYSFTFGHASNQTLQFINPVPQGTSHTRGLADSYANELKTTNASGSLVYNITLIRMAPQDGVFVSANIEESITYQINDSGNGYSGNIGASTNVTQCNGGSFTTGAASTPYAVPFGSILNMDTFYRVAQSHYVVTNAANGYSLTVISDGPLETLGGAASIANGTCDGACSSSSAAAWVTAGNNGFGYTLGNITGTDASFTSNFRLFDDAIPREIMANAAQTTGSRAAMCYQLSVDPTQATGYYFNKLTFVATPRF